MKKWLYVIGSIVVIGIIASVTVWLNANRHYDGNSPLNHLPSSAIAIVKINGTEKYNEAITKAEYGSKLNFVTITETISEALSEMRCYTTEEQREMLGFRERELYISVHANESKEAKNVVISFALKSYKEGEDFIKGLTLAGATATEPGASNGYEAYETKRDGVTYYILSGHGNVYVSKDKKTLLSIAEESEPTLHEDTYFCTLEKTISPAMDASIFVNIATMDSVSFGNMPQSIAKQGKWIELDLDIEPKIMAANGFVTTDRYTFATAIASHDPKTFAIDNILPSKAETFISYSASVRGLSDNGYMKYLESANKTAAYRNAQQELFANTGEDIEALFEQTFGGDMALMSMSSSLGDTANACLTVKTPNGTVAQASLNTIISKYRKTESPREVMTLSPVPSVEIPVYEAFKDGDHLFFLEDYFDYVPKKYYIRYENTLMLADTISVLKDALYETLLNRTFANDANFRAFRTNFTTDNVFFAYSSSKAMKEIIGAERRDSIESYYGFGLQMTNVSKLPYTTICGLYEPSFKSMPPTAWQNKLDTTLIGKPYAVKNHNTGEWEYIVQDAQNKIYLINPTGLVLWSRKVDGPIVGELTQIDYYENKKLQYLFATPESIHLIDRNGNNTAKFPIHLENNATGGVTYIDYGNPSDFRLFIPCKDKTVLLYNKNCERIDGWEMKRTEGIVRSGMTLCTSDDKDYLICQDAFKWYISDRRGNERIHLKPMAPNAYSKIYMTAANTDSAAIITSTADGKLAIIDVKTYECQQIAVDSMGIDKYYMVKLSKSDTFVFINKHHIVCCDRHGKTLSSNRLYLSSIDWAELIDDDYIAIWDKREELGYIINSNGDIKEGFPIPAKSSFAVTFKDGTCNIVVAGQDNTLNNYIK